MAVYQVINGKVSSLPNKCYGVTEGKTVSGLKLYRVKDGKSWKYWERFGTEENPYKISKPEELKMIAQDPDGYYILTKNLDIPGDTQLLSDFYKDPTQVSDLFPILTDVPFTGTLDGQGKWIQAHNWYAHDGQHANRAIVISSDGKNVVDEKHEKIFIGGWGNHINKIHYGFFGINRGTIKNLAINSRFAMYYPQSKDCVAGFLVGINDGTIENCGTRTEAYITAHSTGSDAGKYTGGIAGVNNGVISNCRNETGNMSQASSFRVGAHYSLTPCNYGLVENCSSKICQNMVKPYGYNVVGNVKGGIVKNCKWEKQERAAYGLFPTTTNGVIEDETRSGAW